MVMHTFNPSTQEQRQADPYEFKTSLIFIEFQAIQGCTVRPCLKISKQKLYTLTRKKEKTSIILQQKYCFNHNLVKLETMEDWAS